ncbi:MAG: DUF4276 family protein [Planctomycetaceae bacterium]
MRFVLLVEGQTERDSAAGFLKRWLDRQLHQPVGIDVVLFEGYADLIRKMGKKARMHLEGPKRGEIIAVIGLLDLYGPTFYPAGKNTADERVAWGKEHFEREVGLEKFRLFFAVHEFEAWLLSQPEIFPTQIKGALSGIKHPERINFNEPPAKLLDRIYKQTMKRNYKKTTYGKQMFAKLVPDVAAGKCPHLMALLQEMLKLAKACGL